MLNLETLLIIQCSLEDDSKFVLIAVAVKVLGKRRHLLNKGLPAVKAFSQN